MIRCFRLTSVLILLSLYGSYAVSASIEEDKALLSIINRQVSHTEKGPVWAGPLQAKFGKPTSLAALSYDSSRMIKYPVSMEYYNRIITKYAKRYGVSFQLITAVIRVESNFNANAVSSKGAKGLMQLTAPIIDEFHINPFNPDDNIRIGTKHLASLLKRYQSLDLALAAYNAGSDAVDKFNGIPPYQETQLYVKKILGELTSS